MPINSHLSTYQLNESVSDPGVSTLPITMMNYVEYNYDPTVSALSVILMILTIGIMYILEKTLGLSNFSA